MALYGHCAVCGGETVDRLCATCSNREACDLARTMVEMNHKMDVLRRERDASNRDGQEMSRALCEIKDMVTRTFEGMSRQGLSYAICGIVNKILSLVVLREHGLASADQPDTAKLLEVSRERISFLQKQVSDLVNASELVQAKRDGALRLIADLEKRLSDVAPLTGRYEAALREIKNLIEQFEVSKDFMYAIGKVLRDTL